MLVKRAYFIHVAASFLTEQALVLKNAPSKDKVEEKNGVEVVRQAFFNKEHVVERVEDAQMLATARGKLY